MNEWEPKFVEPEITFQGARQIQYREITIWRDQQDGRLYQFLCIERTPPGDFFVVLCVSWKSSLFIRLQPEDVLSLVRHKLLQFTKAEARPTPRLRQQSPPTISPRQKKVRA